MFSRRFNVWVSLAMVLSMDHTVNGQPAPTITPTTTPTSSQRRHTQYNINYYYARQLVPSPLSSSSSYDYWWPYPPGGVTTTPTTTWWTPSTPTNALSTTDTSIPTLAFTFESDSAASSSSNVFTTASSSLSSSAQSSSETESIMSISALPPSNSSLPATSHNKLSMVAPSNLVYIVPICAVIGVLIGGITAWCMYGCLTRNGHGRRRGRKSYGTLEVGPEYTPPSPRPGDKQQQQYEEGDWVGDEKHAEESEEDDIVHGAASGEEDGTETERFLHPGSAQKRPPRPTVRAKSGASANTVSAAAAAARAKSTRSSRAPSPTPSGRTSLFFDHPDPTDALPWESLRHKSIKRGILARLKYDGQQDTTDRVARRPWQSHGRHDSDLLVADAQADLSRASSSVTSASAALSRASSSVTAGAGFRMLTESPAETPQRERGPEVFAWPSVEEDKYTRVPPRVARSRSRSPEKPSRAASPEKFSSPDKRARAASPPVRRGNTFNAQGRGRSTEIGNGPANIMGVLPHSPPRISSPVLDGALCFTPIPSPPETTPDMPSFASFGGPGAEVGRAEVEVGRMERGAERARDGESRRPE